MFTKMKPSLDFDLLILYHRKNAGGCSVLYYFMVIFVQLNQQFIMFHTSS